SSSSPSTGNSSSSSNVSRLPHYLVERRALYAGEYPIAPTVTGGADRLFRARGTGRGAKGPQETFGAAAPGRCVLYSASWGLASHPEERGPVTLGPPSDECQPWVKTRSSIPHSV